MLSDDLGQGVGVRAGREGASRGTGYTYTYSLFNLPYSRNQQSIVKQLYFNEK